MHIQINKKKNTLKTQNNTQTVKPSHSSKKQPSQSSQLDTHPSQTKTQKTREVMMIENMFLTKKLGEGAFGEVFLAYFKSNPNVYYACKKMRKAKIKESNLEKYLENEMSIYSSLSHPNIVRFITTKETVNSHYLVFELLEGGTLSDIMKEYSMNAALNNSGIIGKGLPEDLIQFYFKQLALAVKYLHDKSILHRDLKPGNILFTFNNTANTDRSLSKGNEKDYYSATLKLIDFGFARQLKSELEIAMTTLGSPLQMPPNIFSKLYNKMKKKESFAYFGYKKEADIWSLGCILFEMLVGSPPFYAQNFDELFLLLQKGTLTIPNMNCNTSGKSTKISIEIVSLISSMLQSQGLNRVDIDGVLNSEFLTRKTKDFEYFDYGHLGSLMESFTKKMMHFCYQNNKEYKASEPIKLSIHYDLFRNELFRQTLKKVREEKNIMTVMSQMLNMGQKSGKEGRRTNKGDCSQEKNTNESKSKTSNNFFSQFEANTEGVYQDYSNKNLFNQFGREREEVNGESIASIINNHYISEPIFLQPHSSTIKNGEQYNYNYNCNTNDKEVSGIKSTNKDLDIRECTNQGAKEQRFGFVVEELSKEKKDTNRRNTKESSKGMNKVSNAHHTVTKSQSFTSLIGGNLKNIHLGSAFLDYSNNDQLNN